MLLAEDLGLTDEVRNLEVLIERTRRKQGRFSVVICAHRQNLGRMDWKRREESARLVSSLRYDRGCGLRDRMCSGFSSTTQLLSNGELRFLHNKRLAHGGDDSEDDDGVSSVFG